MTTTPQRFTKRPVTIEAIQYDEHDPTPAIEWIRDNDGSAWLETRIATASRPAVIAIETLEGTMNAQPGDWIIRGVQGEFYPCKPDIFEATYEPAAEHVEGEQADPTDAEIKAAAESLHPGLFTLSDFHYGIEFDNSPKDRPYHQEEALEEARAALVAAREVSIHE